jgi:hypothetical protein
MNMKKINTTNEIENESKLMPVIDAMGREIFWEDLGRKND